MKKLLLASLLVLPLLALPSKAQAWAWPVHISFGGCGGCGPCGGCGGCSGGCWIPPLCGPWYLYWPMEAHFQVPAPTGYPYWPSPMSMSGMGGAVVPNFGGPVQGPALTPAGYYSSGYGYGYSH